MLSLVPVSCPTSHPDETTFTNNFDVGSKSFQVKIRSMKTPTEEEREEDYGALIYRESQLRKAEAEAAAAARDAKKEEIVH